MALRAADVNVKLSPSEERLMALLPRDGRPITTRDLANKYWNGDELPFHHRTIITGIVRALEKKTARRNPRVKKSRRNGPNPILVWLEGKMNKRERKEALQSIAYKRYLSKRPMMKL